MIGSPAPLSASPFEVSLPILLPGTIQTLPIFPAFPIGFPVTMTPTMATVKGGIKSGRDMRAPQQQIPVWEFEINFEELRDQTQNQVPGYLAGFTEFMQLSQLFIGSVGQFGQFLFNAWWDDSRAGQEIAYGDGASTAFTITRTWGFGALQFTEPVGAVNTMISVQIAGVTQSPSSYYVSANNVLNFTVAPAPGALITATFSFYYLCQFADDQHNYSEFYKDRWTVKIKFKSVLPEQPSIGGPEGPSFGTWPPVPPLIGPAGQYYFEITLGTAAASQSVGGYLVGFANSAASLILPPGLYDTNGTVSILGGTSYYKNAGSTNALQNGFNTGHVLGVAVDTVAQKFWIRDITAAAGYYPDNNSTPTGTGYDLSTIAGTGPLYFVFGSSDKNPTSGDVPGVLTLNAGATAFAGTIPAGYSAWDGTGQTGWGKTGSLTENGAGSYPGISTLAATASGLKVSIQMSGSLTANGWYQNAWPAGTYLVSAYAPDGWNASIYYTPTTRSGGELNGPVDNNSWLTATVVAMTNTAKSR